MINNKTIGRKLSKHHETSTTAIHAFKLEKS